MAKQGNDVKKPARLLDVAFRCKEVADSLQLGVDQAKLTSMIGKPTSVHYSEDLSQEWIYRIDDGVFFKIFFDQTECVEGYEFSGFEELFQILGRDFSGTRIRPGDKD
jgi:hypothetical protein